MPTPPPTAAPTDDELAERAKQGELGAFNALVGRYQRPVFGLCLRMLSSPPAAEDAAQDAFVSAWRGIGGYRGGSFQAWMLRIAGNQCRDELRKRKRRPTDSLDSMLEAGGDSVAPPSRERSPEGRAMGAETASVIQQGLATLPPEQRQAILLSDVHGLPYDEIAQAMGTSVGTVKSRISRGRARLRSFLTARGELPGGRGRQAEHGAPSAPAARSPS
ncbi:MAG: sigma-70 family RNA polymerase sigma factor [Chloroflexi bacterium]|nr:sigma-70 family RNA polymerase sigma factor [Chloroflexota bacterium]